MKPSHVSEQLLCLFVADAARSGLQYSTIKTYLAAVRHFAIANGGRDPFAGSLPTLGKASSGSKVDRHRTLDCL